MTWRDAQNRLPKIMWAVVRDKEIYLIRPTYAAAAREISILREGSKHEWHAMRVSVHGAKPR